MAVEVGQPVIDTCLQSHLGSTVRLSDFQGKCNLVLVFFPLAWTPI